MADKNTYIGELKILQQLNDYEFAFEADILRNGPVQGGRWVFNNIDEYYKTFAGRPVLVAYINSKVGDGHNSRDKVDINTGEEYRSFTDATAERIVGMISEDLSDLSLIERDGYTWVRVKGHIWAEYAKELVDTIMRTGRMSVSIEADVFDVRRENGVEYYDRWAALGLTILGQDVPPAVPGANIRALEAMEEEFTSMKLRVASLVNGETTTKNPKNKSKEVKKKMTKSQLATYQEKFGAEYRVLSAKPVDGGTRVILMRVSDKAFLSYLMGDKDTGVYPEKFAVCNASIVCETEDGPETCAEDACDLISAEVEAEKSECEKACTENARLSTELEAVKAQLTAMQSFETKRRVASAKDKAKEVLAKFNLNRAEKVPESVISNVLASADSGEYTNIVTKDGDWEGCKAVERDVLALCATAQMEIDSKTARNNQTIHVWDKLNVGGGVDNGTPEALLSRLR